MNIIFALLIFPTNFGGVPFDIVGRVPIFFVAVIADILFNSLYGIFEKRNRLFLWITISMVAFFLLNPLSYSIFFSLFYAPKVASVFINTVLLLLPVIIIESIGGALIGFKIFQRLEKSGLI